MGCTKKERAKKRQLVRWNDDLDKQVLLAVQYASNEAGVRIPWEEVANLMGQVTGEDKFSGGAIVQHLSKLRNRMESHQINVPPALKRGTTTNAPSKVYAAGNKRKGGPSKAKNPSASTVKPKKSKAQGIKSEWEDEDDSDDIPVRYDQDDDEDSDGEYGGPKKKRRVSGGKGRAKKQVVATMEKEEDEEDLENSEPATPVGKATSGKETSLKTDAEIQQSIESSSPSPLPRTRGVKHNYSKIDAGSEENGDEDDDAEAKEEAEEAEDFKERVKSDGEISPRTIAEPSVATAPELLDLQQDSMLSHTDDDLFGLGSTYNFGQQYGQHPPFQFQQYQMPLQSSPGFPQSTGTSISTNRTGSMASLTSAMATPAAYVNSASYGSMVSNDVSANIMSDDFMYGDQYNSSSDYFLPNMNFSTDFETRF